MIYNQEKNSDLEMRVLGSSFPTGKGNGENVEVEGFGDDLSCSHHLSIRKRERISKKGSLCRK